MPSLSPLRIAIVVPVFNEEQVLPELFKRLAEAIGTQAGQSWSVILIDDGCRDRSARIIADQALLDPRFELLSLSRNFGHQAALMAGLEHAHAQNVDAVITMDADLQDPPELIGDLLQRFQSGAEVVLAVRRSRQEHGLRRMGFDLFHRFFNALADFRIVSNTGTFGLLGRDALAALVSLPERHRFFPGIRAWVGFETAEIMYDRLERVAGKPAQTFIRLVRYALDGLFSFSYLPLRILTYVGLFCSCMGVVLATFFIVRRLLGVEVAFTGFTTLVTLTLVIGGIQLVGIGIIGEYLARVYDEVKQRPLYIIKKKRP